MDENKLNLLRAIKYEIRKTCSTCSHGSFPQNDWGTCEQYAYQHIKHGESRQLSINRNGYCGQYKMKEVERYVLGPFEEFLK